MCGRYHIDEKAFNEIIKIIRKVNEELGQQSGSDMVIQAKDMQAKDIHPTDFAPILGISDQKLNCRWQRWGFPGFQGKQVIFNARSESALEKKTFRESVENRRIVIPAAWFYEWNRKKEKNTFCRKDQPVLFMAGFYNRCQDEERFVILTTEANESMRPVHDRMPLILGQDEILPWISDRGKTEDFLHKTPCLLERQAEFEQISLF